jgi:hypothetical protein
LLRLKPPCKNLGRRGRDNLDRRRMSE